MFKSIQNNFQKPRNSFGFQRKPRLKLEGGQLIGDTSQISALTFNTAWYDIFIP